jgi:YedE family putative selenium metabolism protein
MPKRFWTPKIRIIAGGLFFGTAATLLTYWGNPPNMGFCAACFLRDTAGALGLHRADTAQYLRPEIVGLLLGAFISSILFGEFRPRGGSGTMIRFFLGAFMMIGALVFLGCPIRALLRFAGGDLNGMTAILGIIAGAAAGIVFLKQGFSLGKAGVTSKSAAFMAPLLAAALLLLLIAAPVLLLFSQKGPGSLHAPLTVSLLAGTVVGMIAQKTRLCFTGGWRDIILARDFHLFGGIAGFFIGALVSNYALGNFSSGLYHWGFDGQPLAHSSHLWNFLSMTLVGLAATLLGGCPLRQTILAGEGDSDGGFTFLGMIAGAAASHNFLLASSPKGPSELGPIAVVIGLVFCLTIGFVLRDRSI